MMNRNGPYQARDLHVGDILAKGAGPYSRFRYVMRSDAAATRRSIRLLLTYDCHLTSLLLSLLSVEGVMILARIDEANSPTLLEAEKDPSAQLIAHFKEKHLRPPSYYNSLECLTIDFGADHKIVDYMNVKEKCPSLLRFKLVHSSHPYEPVLNRNNKKKARTCTMILGRAQFTAISLEVDTSIVGSNWFREAIKFLCYKRFTKTLSLNLENGCDKDGARYVGKMFQGDDSNISHLAITQYQGEEEQILNNRKFFDGVQFPSARRAPLFSNLVKLTVTADGDSSLNLSPILQFMKLGSGKHLRRITLAFMELNVAGTRNLGNIAAELALRQGSALILCGVYGNIYKFPYGWENTAKHAKDCMTNAHGYARCYKCKGDGYTYLFLPEQDVH